MAEESHTIDSRYFATIFEDMSTEGNPNLVTQASNNRSVGVRKVSGKDIISQKRGNSKDFVHNLLYSVVATCNTTHYELLRA